MSSRTWLLVGILLALLSFSAFAEESIPATTGTVPAKNKDFRAECGAPCSGAPFYSSEAAAASAAKSFIDAYYPYNAVCGWSNTYRSSEVPLDVIYEANGTNSHGGTCNAGSYIRATAFCESGTLSGGSCVNATSCPVTGGWTLVGQTCVRDSCVEGEIRNEETGLCAAPEPVCNIPDGSVVTGGYYNVGISPSGAPPTSPCLGSCRTTFEGDGPYEVVIGGVKNYFVKGLYYSTGAVCSPDTPIVDGSTGLPSSSCGANQSSGTINGKTVCVDNTTNQPVPTDAPKTETKTENTSTNPDGSTTTTSTTNHTDGTSTTETTTTATDGTKTTTVVTNGGESENPQDGSATEATQKEILDELKKDDCEANPDRIGCMEQGTIEDDSVIPQIDLVASFVPEFSSAGSCPAPQTIVKGGVTIQADYTMICYYASSLRPFVLAFALLSATLIVVGVRKESD